jgi:Methyltransferase domain
MTANRDTHSLPYMPQLDRAKPWLSIPVPREIDFPKGMLGSEERRLLFWATGHYFQGRGAIVDAGAFAGASAFCLASGLANSKFAHPLARVQSYDWFVAHDDPVAKHLTGAFTPTEIGANFRDVFEYQTGKYRERIDIHQGDFLELAAPPGEIEILFIDIAKTAELNAKVLLDYYPKLIPGVSLVIQQDFYQAWLPYIHTSMMLLDGYFDLVDPLVAGESRVWRLKEAIPLHVLKETVAATLSAEQNICLLDRAITAEKAPPVAIMIKAAKLLALMEAGRIEEARAYDLTLPETDDSNPSPGWEDHLSGIREWMAGRLLELAPNSIRRLFK